MHNELAFEKHTLRPEQKGRHFAYHNFKRMFLIEKSILIKKFSLEFVVMAPIDMMTSSNGNIVCVTGPLWGEFTGEFPLKKASDTER